MQRLLSKSTFMQRHGQGILGQKVVRSFAAKYNAALLMHGNGVYDGTETTEAVSLLVSLSRAGAHVQCYAPSKEQAHVVNHLDGKEQQQTRNVREESARIARGNCKDLAELDANNYDCLIIPGGFGAAKNLSDYGFKGIDMQVDDSVAKALQDFHSQEKIIGLTCIAPILAAKVLGHKQIKMTLGKRTKNFPYAGAIDVAASFGTLMVEMDVDQVCIDWSNNIVTTPAYMQADAEPHQIYDGIEKFVNKVTTLVKQKQITQQNDFVTMDSNDHHEDDLTHALIKETVNRLWQELKIDQNQKLTFPQAEEILSKSFGDEYKKVGDERVKNVFDQIDVDRDGQISKGEMGMFLMSLTRF